MDLLRNLPNQLKISKSVKSRNWFTSQYGKNSKHAFMFLENDREHEYDQFQQSWKSNKLAENFGEY